MPTTTTPTTTDHLVVAVDDDTLVASYGDGSGWYRIYWVDSIFGPLVVTRITNGNDSEFIAQRAHRDAFYDAADTLGDLADWQLTERFGACPEGGSEGEGVVWLDGEAFSVARDPRLIAAGV